MSIVIRLAVAASALCLAACGGAPATQLSMGSRSVSFAPWSSQAEQYRIGPGDELALRFDINPDLNTQVFVGPDGRAVAPLVSGVAVAGMTVEEANKALTLAYASVLRQPQVQALIANYGASQIFVGGEVRQPGAIAIRGRMHVVQAIMAAGGFQDTARSGRVVVLRQSPDSGRFMMRAVDLRATLAGQAGGDFMVLPGDVIFVPRSAISEIDLFVHQYIVGGLPFNLSYSYNQGTLH